MIVQSQTSPQPQATAPQHGVGGPTPIPPPNRGFTRDDLRHSTADCTYRFDAEFSPHLDSSSPHFQTADISEGIHTEIWPTYNRISQEADEEMLKKWNDDLNVLLIFVSLVIKRDSHWTHTRYAGRFILCYRYGLSRQGPRRLKTQLSTTDDLTPSSAVGRS